MIDSVLKGTGNSRFLKSAVPAGTSWADALAMLQAGTFPIDFNGINAEGFQQVGTSLNKANLLKDATAAQIGLPPSTTPDGMFSALANTGELHVWRKTVVYNQPVPEVPGSYTLGSATQLTAGRRNTSTSASSYISNLSVSNEISVDLDGNVTLVNPSTVSLRVTRPASFASDSARTALGGYCYFMATDDTSGEACDMYLPRGQIFYVAENAVYTYAIKEYDSMSSFDAAQLVTGVPGTPAIPAGTTTTYPVSTNPNAWQEGDDAKAAGYVVGEVVKSTGTYGFFAMMGFAYGTSYFQKISDAINVADDGSISHVSPVGDISSSTVLDSASILKERIAGKYITLSENSYVKQPYTNELPPTNVVLYIPADVNVKMIHPEDSSVSNQYALFFDRYQPVTGYPAIPAGTTIEYLGKLGDKARVQVVSYVGTGTYGKDNKNQLTFSRKPRFIMVPGDAFGYAYIPEGMFYYVLAGNYATLEDLYCVWDDDTNTMTWYHPSYPYRQYNRSGTKYTFVAIY